MTRMGWGVGWRVMAEHPLLMKLFVGALLVLLVVMMARRRTREHEAQTAFREHCAARGLDEDSCDERLDRNHARCFAMSYGPGSKTTPESLDRQRYLECVSTSPEAWSAKRRRLLEEEARQRARGDRAGP